MNSKRNNGKTELTQKLLSQEILVNKLTINQIAAKYNWSAPTVKKYLKKYKIKHGRKDIRNSLTKEEFYNMYYVENISLQDIAKRFDTVYLGTLIKQMRAWGYVVKTARTRKQELAKVSRKQHDHLCGGIISKIIGGIKSRCVNGRVIEFNITLDDIWNQFVKQNKKCAISGVEITFPKTNKDYREYKWTASVDRIDSKLGYTPDNIQIVHKKINVIKFDMSTEELFTWCKIIASNNNLC